MAKREDSLAEKMDMSEGSRDQRFMEVLFTIRTEVMNSQKEIHAIQTAQAEVAKKLDESSRKVDKLHDKLLEPDTGLFARVKTLEMKFQQAYEDQNEVEETVKHVDKLVSVKEVWGKVWWYVFAGGAGVLIKYIFDALITKK